MTKKLILLLVTCLFFTSCLFGCGDDNTKDEPTTTEAEVTTNKPEPTTTKAPETTTEEPTTPEETTTEEYVYRGIQVYITSDAAEYFEGLTLEKGDIIYINEVYPSESAEYDGIRGAFVYSFLGQFNMTDEQDAVSSKYWTDATDSPQIPYKDNYCIEYSGESVEFIFGEIYNDTIIFDAVPLG